ncbi:MAG: hypothetical protein ACXWZZ_14650, partial [Solirubrobacteraceae bacterium]
MLDLTIFENRLFAAAIINGLSRLAERGLAGPRGHRLGHVQLAQHDRDDGHRPGQPPRVAAGARMMLQNTGAVLSIAFVLAIVTSAVPKDVLLKIFS